MYTYWKQRLIPRELADHAGSLSVSMYCIGLRARGSPNTFNGFAISQHESRPIVTQYRYEVF